MRNCGVFGWFGMAQYFAVAANIVGQYKNNIDKNNKKKTY